MPIDALPFDYAAYCGPPPAPDALMSAWNLDPSLLAAFALLGVAVGLRSTARERWAGGAAIGVLALAFVSPLCALGTAFLSARMAHHLLMVAVAAPLLAIAFGRLLPVLPLAVATALHAATMLLWHAPPPYAWAVSGVASYWVMESTLLVGAVAFWSSLRLRGAEALPALLAAMAGMGLLAALLTLAPVGLYAAHALTTAPWGWTALEDQQLAGLLLWVPGMLPYLLASLIVLGGALRPRTAASP